MPHTGRPATPSVLAPSWHTKPRAPLARGSLAKHSAPRIGDIVPHDGRPHQTGPPPLHSPDAAECPRKTALDGRITLRRLIDHDFIGQFGFPAVRGLTQLNLTVVLEARVGIEPTHKGFADPFIPPDHPRFYCLWAKPSGFCPLFVRPAAPIAIQFDHRSFYRSRENSQRLPRSLPLRLAPASVL